MSHSAEKCERGDPFWFINTHSFGDIKKISKKNSHSPEKKSKGGGGTLQSRPGL